MKNIKKVLLLAFFLCIGLTFHITPALGAGNYVTVKNLTGANVDEGGTINFEGVSAYNVNNTPVKLYYDIRDPNNVLKYTGTAFQSYTSDTREIYYQTPITVDRGNFPIRGLYKITVYFATSSGTQIDTANFSIFVNISAKPKQPTFTASPTPPNLANTVNVTISQGTGENPAFLPLTLQYRQSIFDNWQTYSSAIPVTDNGTYIYARACTSGGQCSTVGTYQVTNVNAPASTPATNKTAPSAYKEESRIATYFFVGFQKTDSNKAVPVPSGTTPSN